MSENRNSVNLNINPCKMCMPLGAVTAFKGIENSMVILHGSQGCSTYIRRHMAGHYNEPIDIASSSLNEHGTVYGGGDNLKTGLKNIIKLYKPKIIGVASTCLAETIGEDIKRLAYEFVNEEKPEALRIVAVHTPGYGRTQFEGYFAALRTVVKEIAVDNPKNSKINVISASLSPGDLRNIKYLLNSFEVDYILLPDYSDTLDAPYSKDYKKIPSGGTLISDIEKMAGSIATIELGLTVQKELSPGQFLADTYGIPLYRCAIPIGLENTDLFIETISKITAKSIPKHLKIDRGRLIDAMIDSHKHNAEGRAVIYGEPELCYAVSSMCFENGIKPVLISTGTKGNILKEQLTKKYNCESTLVIDDTDFETIQKYSVELETNILIGNSDGKVISEKEGIPIVRIGFPIHDRVGGQRLVSTSYNGSMRLLDDVTNTLLNNKYVYYRRKIFDNYYPRDKENNSIGESENILIPTTLDKTNKHPCYSSGACSNIRMHIPVAPECNTVCNYCNRKYDCVNESRPGVTSETLTPEEATEKFLLVKRKLKKVEVVGIAGPGDALANFDRVKKSIELIKNIDASVTFCISTNGLMLPFYAEKLIDLGITHVTITINAIDPEIGARIYSSVNYLGLSISGKEASEILIKNQLDGLKYLSSKGIVCKVNIVMIKGINEHHVEAVVQKVKECGAYIANIMPLIPTEGSKFENMPLTNNVELMETRKKCEKYLKQMYHCKQCRADAIGSLCNEQTMEFRSKVSETDFNSGTHSEEYVFAVTSKSGLVIDEHFGSAKNVYIYKYNSSDIKLLEVREVSKYCSGADNCESNDAKLQKISDAIKGCNAVITMRMGLQPLKMLESMNIEVFQICDSIKEGIKFAASKMAKVEAL